MRLTEANRAKWEAFCTTLAANFTDNHRMISNYEKVAKKVIGLCGSPWVDKGVFKGVSAGTYGTFWLVDGTEIPSYDVTIVCPVGVAVSKVTSGGFTVDANSDGSYTIEKTAKMNITYRVTPGKLFTDGTQEVTVENVSPAETLPASTCPKTAVDALARIGDTLYLTLQDAANVGDNDGPSTFFTGSNKLTGDFYFGKVKRITTQCFSGTGITSIEAPLATNVNNSAFSGCAALTNAALPCVYGIQDAAFSGCSAMQTISFDSDAVKILSGNAFNGCKAQNLPTFYPSLTNLGYCAFSGSALAGDVSMPHVPIIDRAFEKCTALTSMYAPSCVQYGDYAFSGCTALTNLVVKGSKGCFNSIGKNNAQNPMVSCWALRDITWLGHEAPTNFTSSCFSLGGNGDATTKLPIVHIRPAKDPAVWKAQCAAWESVCNYTKDTLLDSHKMVANYEDVKGSHLIGYKGGKIDLDKKTGKIGVIYDSDGCRCWIVRDNYETGFTVIIR